MALTRIQRSICRLIAQNRLSSGESYIAGAAALNELITAPRVSRDLDLFHDTQEALEATWDADRRLLEEHGYQVLVLRERPSFVEARVSLAGESLLMEWARDSAYRFFPLQEHDELGLVLHPFDLGANKVLTLVGRLEVRDWIDVIACDEHIQPLGYLAWAACGKDPGFSPEAILDHAKRSGRYSAEEVLELSFAGKPPDAGELSRKWRTMLHLAREVIKMLPADEVGKCVLSHEGALCRYEPSELLGAIDRSEIFFHAGCIRGAFPRILQDSE
jgi:hypothetical protein